MPLPVKIFIGDIKSRYDFWRICPKNFRFGQIVHILWPFEVGKNALFGGPCPSESLAQAHFVTSSKELAKIVQYANSL